MALFFGHTINARPVAFMLGFPLIGGYGLAASVGVWRSAAPYWKSLILMEGIWAAAARIIVATWIARLVLGWIKGGAVLNRKYNQRRMFRCGTRVNYLLIAS